MTNEMSASTPQPPPGWYPDPSGKPGQMYWDGQRWRTHTPPPAAAPAPWHTARPPWEKRPGFWSKTKIVLAAGAGLVVAIVVVAMIGTAASGPSGQPAAPGQPSSGSHSPAYNRGYEWGNQHEGPSPFEQWACGTSGHRQEVARRDWDDWMQGCMDGIRAQKAEEPSTP
jgi:hypothetical protein